MAAGFLGVVATAIMVVGLSVFSLVGLTIFTVVAVRIVIFTALLTTDVTNAMMEWPTKWRKGER